MANHYFGDFGDVWKHLPLASLLDLLEVTQYWETNSGAALYRNAPWSERIYGIDYFYAHRHDDGPVGAGPYGDILDACSRGTLLELFPGSPFIAMYVLGIRARYLFCDIDGPTLDNVSDAATQRGLSSAVNLHHGDGAEGVIGALEDLAGIDVDRTFVMLDPFRPFESRKSEAMNGRLDNKDAWESSAAGSLDPIRLFALLRDAGVMSMLWYGYRSGAERMFCHAELRNALKSGPAVWCGEETMALMDSGRCDFQLQGCGIAAANLPDEGTSLLTDIANSLCDLYANVEIEGQSAPLVFDLIDLSAPDGSYTVSPR